jgi:hypothetical protein
MLKHSLICGIGIIGLLLSAATTPLSADSLTLTPGAPTASGATSPTASGGLPPSTIMNNVQCADLQKNGSACTLALNPNPIICVNQGTGTIQCAACQAAVPAKAPPSDGVWSIYAPNAAGKC